MYTKGDFHIHTTKSDGDYTPTEIIMFAKESNVDTISITDHKTMSGVEEAIKAGEWLGVNVIPGIELSTRFNGKKVHILGYFTNEIYKDKDFISALRYAKKGNVKLLEKLIGDDVDGRKDLEKNKITTQTGIDLLKYFGGSVVLAHPIRLKNGMLDPLLEMNFDGIEALYPENTVEQNELYKGIAREKGWFYTAGSDFHSDSKTHRHHGLIGQVYLNNYEIEKFIIKLKNNGNTCLGQACINHQNSRQY